MKAQNVRRHWLAAANDAARMALEPYSQHSPNIAATKNAKQRDEKISFISESIDFMRHKFLPHFDKISMSKRPFNVHVGEHAIAKIIRKTFTIVSSLTDDPCAVMLDVARSNCAGNHNESSSGSIPA